MIEQLSAERTNSLSVRAQIGTVTIVADVYADVTVGGDVVPLVPIRPGLTVTVGDVVLIWRVGESWIVGEILPGAPETLVPEGFIDAAPIGGLPLDWTTTETAFNGTPSVDVGVWSVIEGAGHSGDRLLALDIVGIESPNGYSTVVSPNFTAPAGDYFAGVFMRAASTFSALGSASVVFYIVANEGEDNEAVKVNDVRASLGTDWDLLSGTFTLAAESVLSMRVISKDGPAEAGNTIFADDLLVRLTN